MKALMVAMAAMIGFTACNKEAKREGDAAAGEGREAAREAEAGAVKAEDAASREARQTGNDVREGAGQLTDKASEESRQSGRDIREGADKAGARTAEETRQTTRDVKEGAGSATDKVREEARQTNRDLKEAMSMDDGKTAADKQIITRIRTALRADKDVASESRDVRIIAKDGEVTLEGTVTSKEAKEGIARVSRKIAGATKVDDEVKVAERVGAGASDR